MLSIESEISMGVVVNVNNVEIKIINTNLINI